MVVYVVYEKTNFGLYNILAGTISNIEEFILRICKLFSWWIQVLSTADTSDIYNMYVLIVALLLEAVDVEDDAGNDEEERGKKQGVDEGEMQQMECHKSTHSNENE